MVNNGQKIEIVVCEPEDSHISSFIEGFLPEKNEAAVFKASQVLPKKSDITILAWINPEIHTVKLETFLNQTKALIVVNLIDPNIRQIMETYQKAKANPHHPRIIDYSKSQILDSMEAAAALQVGLALGISPEKIQEKLREKLR